MLAAPGSGLVVLATSPRVAPGLLTAAAWDLLRGASRVLTDDPAHPQIDALAAAGVACEVIAGRDPAGLAAAVDAAVRAAAVDAAAVDAAVRAARVVWLAGGDDEATAALLAALDELPGGGPTRQLADGSHDLPGARVLDLVAVMDTLRRRCPWDAGQTHESLAPHLIEESYEALEALEERDQAALREELGDVLLQVVFHARVAAERTDSTGYTIDDVARGIVAKLVRRHPHVFGAVQVSGADEVKQNWDAIKAAERALPDGRPASALDGVPFGQPALALAAQLQRRAERAGAPAALAAGEAHGPGYGPGDGAKLGAELFALVARARAAGLDPESELRTAARRYADRVRAWESERPAWPGQRQPAAGLGSNTDQT